MSAKIRKQKPKSMLELMNTIEKVWFEDIYIYIYIYLARTPEIGQGLGRVLSCGARKPEQTYMDLLIIVDFMTS